MEIESFIFQNRREIDDYIREVYPKVIIDSNEEREELILNDQLLWNWARSEGVDI